jgi:hypothetical protein
MLDTIRSETQGYDDTHRISRDFTTWLSSSNSPSSPSSPSGPFCPSAYYITGKPGAGKSTLMKFLAEDERTKRYLDLWHKDTLVVSSYFWLSGSPSQRSVANMYRVLLSKILRAAPTIFERVVKAPYHQARSQTWLLQAPMKISDKQVETALEAVMRDDSLKIHLCLFIDGLDEAQPSPSKDSTDLIEMLLWWSTSPWVKICMSSRDQPEFRRPIDDAHIPCLPIHEATMNDMRAFCIERLSDVADDEDKDHLVQTLCYKAEGIFLWLVLVMQQMREFGTPNAQSLSRYLDTLSGDLDTLFESILGRMSATQRNNALMLLKLAETVRLNPQGRFFPYTAALCLPMFRGDERFAEKDSFLSSLWDLYHFDDHTPLEGETRESIMRQARLSMMQAAKGLLDLCEPYFNVHVAFSHRSALDFVRSSPSAYHDCFDGHHVDLVLLQLNLAHVQILMKYPSLASLFLLISKIVHTH